MSIGYITAILIRPFVVINPAAVIFTVILFPSVGLGMLRWAIFVVHNNMFGAVARLLFNIDDTFYGTFDIYHTLNHPGALLINNARLRRIYGIVITGV
mgnify:CR=1 FL=1